MASVADICNVALSHLGARTQVNSITPPDGSVEAGYCARFYPIARKELLESASWAFARRRVTLTEVDNASNVWQYAYAEPAGMIDALRILNQRYLIETGASWPLLYEPGSVMNWALVDELFKERGSSEFDIENGVIYTNEPEAILLYTVDVTDTTKFSATFTSALGMLLASYLAGPIIKGMEGAQVGAKWREAAAALAKNAATGDANATNQRADHVAAHIRGRL